jgi:hypothetical protein
MIQLMTTDGCHLCEQAIGMFYYAKQQKLIDETVVMELVDIVTDDQLVDIYGVRIPVLVNTQTHAELGWPFELDDLVRWVNQ